MNKGVQRGRLARAAESDQPRAALEIFRGLAGQAIAARGRGSYRIATGYTDARQFFGPSALLGARFAQSHPRTRVSRLLDSRVRGNDAIEISACV